MRRDIEDRERRFIFWVDVMHFLAFAGSVVMFFRGHADKWVQLLAAVIVIALLVSLLLRRILRRAIHLWTYVYDVVPSFQFADNRPVWERAAASRQPYRYIGVSGHTMELEFRKAFAEGVFPVGMSLQFLLMSPGSESVNASKRHELDNASEERIASEALMTSERIAQCARYYSSLHGVNGLQVEVRLFDAYTGYWAHFIGAWEAIVGPLYKGHPGYSSTVLHLRDERNPLLRFYVDEFERIWASASPFPPPDSK